MRTISFFMSFFTKFLGNAYRLMESFSKYLRKDFVFQFDPKLKQSSAKNIQVNIIQFNKFHL